MVCKFRCLQSKKDVWRTWIQSIVAKKAIEAKKKAKRNWETNLKNKHNDDYSGINYLEQVDDLHPVKIKNWEINLKPDPEKRSEKIIPDWYGYMRIDKY